MRKQKGTNAFTRSGARGSIALREYLDSFWSDVLSAYSAEVAKQMRIQLGGNMLEPITQTIEVPCNQKNAFDIFVNTMQSWWPLDRFSCSAYQEQAPKSLKVDAQAGGKIVEIGHDDTEHIWGSFKDFDPYGYFSMNFHMMMPHCESLVEVKFTELRSSKYPR